MNTHETYVSLEVAKLLKQAGFDWEVNHFFHLERFSELESPYRNHNSGLDAFGHDNRGQYMSAPTLDVAQRWLREKNLLLYIPPCHIDGKWLWRYWITNCINKEDTTQIYSVKKYDTYEEAQEAGIKKALEIILEKGE